jgi:hypothetical protein
MNDPDMEEELEKIQKALKKNIKLTFWLQLVLALMTLKNALLNMRWYQRHRRYGLGNMLLQSS